MIRLVLATFGLPPVDSFRISVKFVQHQSLSVGERHEDYSWSHEIGLHPRGLGQRCVRAVPLQAHYLVEEAILLFEDFADCLEALGQL
jgi:hypothetical protein